MKIKICGLKRKDDIAYVNEAKPEFIGFVFAGTKRKITAEQARELKAELSKDIKAFGVFVNEPVENVADMVNEGILDVVQLHGDEDEKYILDLTNRISAETQIVKAIRVQTKEQVISAEKLPVSYLLLDAFSKKCYGGEGLSFDHELIPNLSKPYFLAGGINLENVSSIIDGLKERNIALPYAIDVSSSVETDSVKDKDKIITLVNCVHEL